MGGIWSNSGHAKASRSGDALSNWCARRRGARSFLVTLADRRDPRPVLLFYADKTRDAMSYRDDLERLRETGVLTSEILANHLPDESFARMDFLCVPRADVRRCAPVPGRAGGA